MRTLPRVVAVDLDGTLLRSDGTLSDRTAATLSAVRAAGTRVVVVTARPPRSLDLILAGREFPGPVLCSNGAIRYEPQTDVIELIGPLPIVVAQATSEVIASVLPHAAFALETGIDVRCEPAYQKRTSFETARIMLGSRAELWSGLPVKLLVWLPDDDLAVTAALLQQQLPDVHVSFSGASGMLEISAAGVDKASALSSLCASWGVSAIDVMAFGDMPNDLPMLRWAGQAFAMANAHPLVLAEIAGRALSNQDDGVAVMLESFRPEHSAQLRS